MKRQTLNVEERATCSLFFLSFNNLSLSAGSKAILADLSINLTYNRLVVIKGRVGSGKSTILKMLGGLIAPSIGDFKHINKDGGNLNAVYLHSQPEFNFITGYIRDELNFAGVPLDMFPDLLGRSVYDMSGGELKKLSIMMSLARDDGAVLLVDEPLDMLDDTESQAVADLIISKSENRPFIIATHDTHFDNMADIIITIE